MEKKYSARPLLLEDMRVERNFIGGSLLNRWKGIPDVGETDLCEEWHVSVVETQNQGARPGEGLSLTILDDGSRRALRDLIASDPEAYLGKEFVRRVGTTAQLGIRTGDSIVRLSLQAHPKYSDAKRLLRYPTGKTEAWYILETRPIGDQPPYILAGFREGVTPEKIRELFYAQDIPALEASMHKLPIRAGDVVLIPAGAPHAMGPGIMFMEVAEACDYTFKLEHNMPTRPLTDEEMHYGLGFDAMLACFDYTTYTPDQARKKFLKTPAVLHEDKNITVTRLLDHKMNPRFTMFLYSVHGQYILPPTGAFRAGVAVRGNGHIRCGSYERTWKQGSGIFFPADMGPVTLTGEFTFLCSDGAICGPMDP